MTLPADDPDTVVISLPEKLDYAACRSFEADLRAASGKAVKLACGDVKFVSAFGAELMLSALAERRENNLAFSIEAPSQEFGKGLELIGLNENDLINEGAA